ncbi:MAG TPA: hydroxymethylbilane synthase [Pseudolysinimonas sp.]|nr:hydroxymethylbilane synthase [Pseudolysinimonas sp.]
MRLGTRGSALALAQSTPVAERLGAELVVVDSEGDGSSTLRSALLAGDVDVVVHSLDELPTGPAEGLVVAAVLKRAEARDALCARASLTLDTLPAGARVGCGSALRRAQVLSRRPDLDVVQLSGDVDSLLDRVGADLDAVVLAAAALESLGLLHSASEIFGIDGWPTAPAQGALAVEVRAGQAKSVQKLQHRPTRLATEAERGVLRRLGAGRAAPVGAHALLDDGLLFLSARVYSLDGTQHLTSAHALYPEDSAHPAEELAERVAEELLAAGAADLAPLGAAS